MPPPKRKKKPKRRTGYKKKKFTGPPPVIVRVRLPRDEEVFGLCERRLGGSRMRVICLDGKTRVCRIPGRLKRSLWVRQGDTLLIKPWEFSGDEKGDVLYKYRPLQVRFLKEHGHLKGLDDLDEF